MPQELKKKARESSKNDVNMGHWAVIIQNFMLAILFRGREGYK